MKIVVCVKQVPDTAAKVVVEDGRVTWGDAPLVINPWDEYAVEAAIKTADAAGGSVTVLTATRLLLAAPVDRDVLVAEQGKGNTFKPVVVVGD